MPVNFKLGILFCRDLKGMRNFIIDCAKIETASEFWNAYVTITEPEGANYFGKNLDAFWDAISAGGPGWPGECEIKIINTAQLRKINNGAFFEALRCIANDSEAIRIQIE